jgi:serine kinase of HPr protein (carbohydrate metabolism regulator)
MTPVSSETLHASCVSIAGRAVLIEGRSGSGKSDLALRLIDRGASLVSDDYVICTRREGRLFASAPASIHGKMEVRGIGIVAVDTVEEAEVAIVVNLVEEPERLPDPGALRLIAGVKVPEVALPSLQPSAPIKVEMALRQHSS